MPNRISGLFGLSILYVLGITFSRGAVFILIPLYTRYLIPSEFGILALTGIVTSLSRILLSFGFEGAAFRFYFIYTDAVLRKQFYGTIWLFTILMSGVITLVITLFATDLLGQLFAQISSYSYLAIAIWIAYLRSGFEIIPLQIFRARGQASSYLSCSLATFLLAVSIQYYFISVLNLGLLGALYGDLIAAFVMAIVYSVIMYRYCNLYISWKYLQPALAYSLPLVPHFIANWVLGLSDRIILERFVGMSQLGVYSLGDQFRQGYGVITSGANASIMPTFGKASQNSEALKNIPSLTTYYVLGIAFIGLTIAILAPEVIFTISPQPYHAAIYIIPWLISGMFFQGLYSIPMNVLSQTAGKTQKVWFATLTAGAINITLNLLTVPHFGIVAAAINTTFGYLILFLLINFMAQQVVHIQYQYTRILKIVLSTSLTFFIVRFANVDNVSITTFSIKLILLISVLPSCLFLANFFNQDEKLIIFQFKQAFIKSVVRLI